MLTEGKHKCTKEHTQKEEVAVVCRSPDSDGHSRSLPDVRAQTAFSRQSTAGVTAFPLYCEGVDRGRFAYAIYLLNKVMHPKDTSPLTLTGICSLQASTAVGASALFAPTGSEAQPCGLTLSQASSTCMQMLRCIWKLIVKVWVH